MSSLPAPPPAGSHALDRQRLTVVLITLAVNVFGMAALTLASWSDWRTGLGLALLNNAILLVHVLRRGDGLLGRLLLFGLVLGLAELPADAWLVDVTRTLDYSLGGGPMIWRSPIWMPFAWQIVAIQLAYIGLRLCRWLGPLRGTLLTALLGAVNIPYYEELAVRTHWWQYGGCRMLLHTPYYIILGELLIAGGLALLGVRLARAKAAEAALLGVAGGALIFASYAAAYGLTDVWIPAR